MATKKSQVKDLSIEVANQMLRTTTRFQISEEWYGFSIICEDGEEIASKLSVREAYEYARRYETYLRYN